MIPKFTLPGTQAEEMKREQKKVPRKHSPTAPAHALAPPGVGWRQNLAAMKAQFLTRNIDEVHEAIQDDVYQRGLRGQTFRQITLFYGTTPQEFQLYYPVWQLANAALQTAIVENTIDYGMTSNMPVAKIWLGKAVGGLSETVRVETEDETPDVQINVTVLRRREETQPIEDAIETLTDTTHLRLDE